VSFKDLSFSQRFSALGDLAEGVFERTYDQPYVRFGLSRPPIHLGGVPGIVRFAPDYISAKGFIEIQGFGGDQTFKLKHSKAEALQFWHGMWRLDFWVFDSKNQRYAWLRWPELYHACATAEVRHFPEGYPYSAIKAKDLPVVGDWASVST
jgi:hypothetical protein